MKDRIKAIRESLKNDKGKKYTQADFAAKLNVSKSTIEAIEYGRREATDRFIADIVREFNVNETWLRTGSGTMFKELARKEEINLFLSSVLKDNEDTFRFRLINALAELPVEQWEMLADLCEKIVNGKKDNQED